MQEDKSGTLGCGNDQTIFQPKAYGISAFESNAMKSANPHSGVYEADTSRTLDLNGGNPACNQGGICVVEPLVYSQQRFGEYAPAAAAALRAAGGDYGGGSENLASMRYAVRRLTPLECERLQGFPDGWTDIGEWRDSKGKLHKPADSPRYKALGNSIALPFWQWMLRRMCEISGARTMGSLFDGIGGFPLCWERINGEGSCRWASEIEEFPIAVTKIHFKEN